MNSLVEGGVRLGTWVGNQRARKSRLTSDQISQLDSLGFNWDPYTEQWEEAFAALQKFHKREGHCRVTVTHTEEGIKLGRWVSNQRHQNKGALTPAQLEKLKSVGFSWNPLIEQWEEGFEALQKFYKREGHSSVMATFMENGFGLGRWVVSQRTRKTRLTPEQINRLNSLEFTWDPLADRWGQAFAALQRFHKQEGHCRVAQTFQVNGLRLGTWVSNLRKIKDSLTPNQVSRLNSIGFSWDPLADRWEQAFVALQRFHKQEGHCRVAQTFQVNGLRLGTWVSNLRKIKDRLTPEQIKRLNSLGFIWKS
jgi:hypothetical protein